MRVLPYDLRLIEEYEKREERKPIDLGYFIVVGIFLGALVTSQFQCVKICRIGFLVFPAGAIAYAVTFLCTDIISEVYGRRASSMAVVAGFTANIALIVLLYTGLILPPLAASYQEKYSILMFTPRIVAASLAAYLISQTHDVLAFHYWKARTQGRWLWLRNNASTMVSQAIDTIIFITLGFAGVVSFRTLLQMIASHYTIKFLCALCDTPFCYLGAWLLRRH